MLFSLAAAYWRGDDTGERSMCLTFGLFFFVVAMAILVIDESLLDFGLDKGNDDDETVMIMMMISIEEIENLTVQFSFPIFPNRNMFFSSTHNLIANHSLLRLLQKRWKIIINNNNNSFNYSILD